MNGPDGKPTKLDDDFEPLVPALEGSFEKKFSELSAELQEWIKHDRRAAMLALMWDVSGPGRRRTLAQQGTGIPNKRDCDTKRRYCSKEPRPSA